MASSFKLICETLTPTRKKCFDWARSEGRQFTLRLVKGAYWDFEKVMAAQKSWKVPVYLSKAETDANYEQITRLLLENRAIVYPAFASHNVLSYCSRSDLRAQTWHPSRRLRISDVVRNGNSDQACPRPGSGTGFGSIARSVSSFPEWRI